MKLRSVAAHGLAFVLPPAIVAILATLSVVKDVMMHREPKPVGVTKQNPQGSPLPEPPARDGRPVALIVLSNQGTSALDLLATVEVLGRSGIWQIVTAAPERRLSATTASVSILPDFDLKDAPTADLLVLPGIVDPNYPPLVEAVKQRGPQAQLVLAPGEGSRLAALAGLLEGHQATGHIVSIHKLAQQAQGHVRFVEDRRVVVDGARVTSAGGAGAIDAALATVAARAGTPRAQAIARELDWSWSADLGAPRGTEAPRGSDFARLLLNAGFDWGRRYAGILLSPGISELGLGAWIETFPRSLSARAYTVAPERSLVRTAHGLQLVPSETLPDSFPPDVIVTAPGVNVPALLESWSRDLGIPTQTLPEAPGRTLDQALQALAEQDGPEVARISARLIEAQIPDPLRATGALHKKTAWLLFRIVLLGSLGILIFRSVLRGIVSRRNVGRFTLPA